MTIKVSKKVYEGLEFVRESGLTNMFDYHAVQHIAFDNNYYETVDWMENNKTEYAKGIFEGFEIE